MKDSSNNRLLSYSYDYKIARERKQIKLVFDELNKENIADVHKFCEDNLFINARDQTFSQPLEYFERATLLASNFRKELSIVAYREGENSSINNGNAEESGSVENKERKIVGFFMGILSSSILSSKQTHPILKFFVIDKSYRRIGLGSFLLKELYRRFKSMGIKGKIEVLCSPPEYW
ncbi:MAG: GNAT family N-acetyltransferase, partial [Promethearchaeota archaeon]